MKTKILSLFLCLSALAVAAGDSRVWRFQSGAKFEGEFVRLSGTNAVLVAKAGKQYTLPLDKLTPEDQQFAAEAKPAPEPVEVFGIRLGQKFTSSMATRHEVPMPPPPPGIEAGPPLVEYVFRPTKPLTGFTEYNLWFTPESKLVYSVCARANFVGTENVGKVVDAESKLKAALKEKYGEGRTHVDYIGSDKLEYEIYRTGDVEISVRSGASGMPGQTEQWSLSICYTDKKLEAQAEQEKGGKERQSLKNQL